MRFKQPKRFQFSLLFLFSAVALICIATNSYFNSIKRHHDAILNLHKKYKWLKVSPISSKQENSFINSFNSYILNKEYYTGIMQIEIDYYKIIDMHEFDLFVEDIPKSIDINCLYIEGVAFDRWGESPLILPNISENKLILLLNRFKSIDALFMHHIEIEECLSNCIKSNHKILSEVRIEHSRVSYPTFNRINSLKIDNILVDESCFK
jgi:hypothetical protein